MRDGVIPHGTQIAARIRDVAQAHRAYRRDIQALTGKDIRIAMDEWNYWYGANEYGELGVRYFLQDGLGIAVGLHEFFRHSDLYYMANYAQTVNVIGAIKTTKTQAEFETTGLVLKLYRERCPRSNPPGWPRRGAALDRHRRSDSRTGPSVGAPGGSPSTPANARCP